MEITKGVILAGGYGTRVLPATKAMPKEMLTIVDKPSIQYIVEEFIASGIKDILIVISKGKTIIEDHFDKNIQLENTLIKKNSSKKLLESIKIADNVNIYFTRQKEALGTGHCVLSAEGFTAEEPFVIAYADDLFESTNPEMPVTLQVINAVGGRGAKFGAVSMKQVDKNLLQSYSSLKIEPLDSTDFNSEAKNVYKVTDMIEKPAPGTEFSEYAIIGRCALPPTVFEIIRSLKPGYGGEIQLTDAMKILAQRGNFFGIDFDGTHFDTGSKIGLLKTITHFGLKHPETARDFSAYLTSLSIFKKNKGSSKPLNNIKSDSNTEKDLEKIKKDNAIQDELIFLRQKYEEYKKLLKQEDKSISENTSDTDTTATVTTTTTTTTATTTEIPFDERMAMQDPNYKGEKLLNTDSQNPTSNTDSYYEPYKQVFVEKKRETLLSQAIGIKKSPQKQYKMTDYEADYNKPLPVTTTTTSSSVQPSDSFSNKTDNKTDLDTSTVLKEEITNNIPVDTPASVSDVPASVPDVPASVSDVPISVSDVPDVPVKELSFEERMALQNPFYKQEETKTTETTEIKNSEPILDTSANSANINEEVIPNSVPTTPINTTESSSPSTPIGYIPSDADVPLEELVSEQTKKNKPKPKSGLTDVFGSITKVAKSAAELAKTTAEKVIPSKSNKSNFSHPLLSENVPTLEQDIPTTEQNVPTTEQDNNQNLDNENIVASENLENITNTENIEEIVEIEEINFDEIFEVTEDILDEEFTLEPFSGNDSASNEDLIFETNDSFPDLELLPPDNFNLSDGVSKIMLSKNDPNSELDDFDFINK